LGWNGAFLVWNETFHAVGGVSHAALEWLAVDGMFHVAVDAASLGWNVLYSRWNEVGMFIAAL
jgi:hypothetical protein